jgi:hypothetical protein
MARLDAFDRELKVLIDETLSPEARSRMFGQEARKLIEQQDSVNDRAAGRDVQYKTFVDGKASGALETAERVIVAEWDMIDTALRDIHDMLVVKSPILAGDYRRSITLFANGIATDVDGSIPLADEYFFAATVPYARKIERGLSRQAPDGVFEVVAALANRRFGNVVRVRFSFRQIAGSAEGSKIRARSRTRDIGGSKRASWVERQPAIVITAR